MDSVDDKHQVYLFLDDDGNNSNNNNNNNNNNNRELIERFRKLKALYNFKKNNAQLSIIIQINGIQAYQTYEN